MKRRYDKKLVLNLESHERFLLSRLAEDWNVLRQKVEREEVIGRRKETVATVGKNLLKLLAIGGALVAGPIAAGMVGIASTGFSRHRAFYDKRSFRGGRGYLHDHGFIQLKSKGGDVFGVTLTRKGKRLVLRHAFRDLKLKTAGKWDGYWRIVIFDIRNRQKWARDGFRTKLKELDFYPLQESVFITPYSCDEELALLTAIFCITHNVHVIKTAHISNDEALRKHFNLS